MNANKMTAIDLAECLTDFDVIKDGPFSQIIGKKSAEMLRKQDAAIKQLREALEYHIEQTRPIERSWQALTATEEFVNG